MKWEYMIIEIFAGNSRNNLVQNKISSSNVYIQGAADFVKENLDKFGREGWEATICFNSNSILFKRMLQE